MELSGVENAVPEGADVLDDAAEDSGHFTGDNAVDQAVEALQVKRDAQSRQRPRAEELEVEDPDLVTLKYVDGRDPKKPMTAAEAARDYGLYREHLARQILEGSQAEFDRQAEEAVQPEQQTEQTQESAEQQWQAYYESLPPEGKAQITSAIEFQNKAAVADDWANTHLMALTDLLGRLNGQTAGAFADIRTPQDVARLRETSPERFALLEQQMAAVGAVHQEAQKVRAAHEQRQAEAFQQNYRAYAAQQDKAVEQLIPELAPNADPEVARKLQLGALEVLKDAGFSQAEAYQAWTAGSPVYLRDARVQKVLSDATRWRLANSRAAKNDLRSKRAPPVPVQRPGTSHDGASFQSERALSEKLAKKGDIHTAVQLLQARRASRR